MHVMYLHTFGWTADILNKRDRNIFSDKCTNGLGRENDGWNYNVNFEEKKLAIRTGGSVDPLKTDVILSLGSIKYYIFEVSVYLLFPYI